MAKRKFLLVTQEVAPYLPADDLSQFGRELPQFMQSEGWEVRIFTPKYGVVNERRNQLHEVIRLSGINITIGHSDYPLIVKVASLQPSRIQAYFTDSEDFFERDSNDADNIGSNRGDNHDRALFFARGTTETVKKLRWEPRIVQCCGWMTAFAPATLKRMYQDNPTQESLKIVYRIAPGEIAPIEDKQFSAKLDGLITTRFVKGLINAGNINTELLHKIAIIKSDAVIIADPNISDELKRFIATKRLPVLTYEQQAQGLEAYSNFYNSLLPAKQS